MILASILHVGNLEFNLVEKRGQDTSTIKNKDLVKTLSSLFGVPGESFEKALCFRSMTSASRRGSVYSRPLDPAAAEDARDALAKALYQRLFRWLVSGINSKIEGEHTDLLIGFLDIYGFGTAQWRIRRDFRNE